MGEGKENLELVAGYTAVLLFCQRSIKESQAVMELEYMSQWIDPNAKAKKARTNRMDDRVGLVDVTETTSCKAGSWRCIVGPGHGLASLSG